MMGAPSTASDSHVWLIGYAIAIGMVLILLVVCLKGPRALSQSFFSALTSWQSWLTLVELPARKLRRSSKWQVGPTPSDEYWKRGYGEHRRICQLHEENGGLHILRSRNSS